MIEIQNLSKKFGKLKVLNNVNLSCNEGECIALIGPNGCGKTTLIKSILGMVIPTEGTIKFKDKSISKNFEYRKDIGYMPQIGRYPENMTIGQILDMIKEIRKSDTQLKVSATLAFLFNPHVLILDEPTAGLDPLASEILKEKIIAEKEKGKLILITSHLLSELDDLITQIIFMQDGVVQFHKTINDLKSSTGEQKISKAIAKILKSQTNE